MTETARIALIRGLARRMLLGSFDEIRVMEKLWSRLEMGRGPYGPLDLSKDLRDWRAERMAETLDRCLYDVFEELALEDRARAGLQAAARSELVNEWAPDSRTIASPVPAAIALDDIADRSDQHLQITIERDPDRGSR